jgi:hypothetical protein
MGFRVTGEALERVFVPPKRTDSRRIASDGWNVTGPKSAQAGEWITGPGPGCGLGTWGAPCAMLGYAPKLLGGWANHASWATGQRGAQRAAGHFLLQAA